MLRKATASVFKIAALPVVPMRHKTHLMQPKKYVENLTLEDLVNRRQIRRMMAFPVQGMTRKSQRGLYHGGVIRSGHRTTDYRKKVKRVYRPYAQKKTYYSKILEKNVKLWVTSKTIRCIERYAGFDNYILLTKPENMASIFGEYLRKLMLEKLNNPELDLAHCEIFGTTKDVRGRLRKSVYKENKVWFPKEIRHNDHTLRYWRGFNEMTKREVAQFKDAVKNRERIGEWVKDKEEFAQHDIEVARQKELMKPLLERNKRKMENRDPEKMRMLNFQLADNVSQLEKISLKKKTY